LTSAPASTSNLHRPTTHKSKETDDTYADAYVTNTATEMGAEASLAATNNTNEYSQLSANRIFTPVAIETAGTWAWKAELAWLADPPRTL